MARYFVPHRCPDTHRITKKHPLCVCVCVFLSFFLLLFCSKFHFFSFFFFFILFDFVTCCVEVQYVSLTGVTFYFRWGCGREGGWVGGRGQGGVGGATSAYLTSSVSWCTVPVDFRCPYFTHFKLRFREAVGQKKKKKKSEKKTTEKKTHRKKKTPLLLRYRVLSAFVP